MPDADKTFGEAKRRIVESLAGLPRNPLKRVTHTDVVPARAKPTAGAEAVGAAKARQMA